MDAPEAAGAQEPDAGSAGDRERATDCGRADGALRDAGREVARTQLARIRSESFEVCFRQSDTNRAVEDPDGCGDRTRIAHTPLALEPDLHALGSGKAVRDQRRLERDDRPVLGKRCPHLVGKTNQIGHGFECRGEACPVRAGSVARMEQRELGGSGIHVSVVGLGCNNFGWRIDAAATRRVVDAALDAGVNFLDTANIYGNKGGSETSLGEILEGRRDRVVLATKFGMDMGDGVTARGARDYVHRWIDESLARLRTDHVDLYYLHQPDPETPIAETLDALDELVRAGKMRAIGCSNFSAEQLAEADRVARDNSTARFVALQNHYNLLRRDDDADVLPLCGELGVSYVPYFPLASGLLTGKLRRGETAPEGSRLAGREVDDETFDQVEALERFAEQRGHTLLELAISALASMPGVVSVIAGATRPEQVHANAAAVGWKLEAGELEELARL